MAEFHEGQEVEVEEWSADPRPFSILRPAKIIAVGGGIQSRLKPGDCEVEFADGSRGVFDEWNVRAVAGAPSQQ